MATKQRLVASAVKWETGRKVVYGAKVQLTTNPKKSSAWEILGISKFP